MHIALWAGGGLALLAVFVVTFKWLGRPLSGLARLFLPVWFILAMGNSAYGVVHAGIAVLNEIGAFAVIFGVPALAAWLIFARTRAA